ncbi:MAG: methenyltetrahydromethanopterin cyclohydrolase [Chloroflexi bacterium]|nr:methenyltetrahydromethanopterin cyclohydrolase [Chloroflexota bacterium]
MFDTGTISINKEAMRLVREILAGPAAMGVLVSRLDNGATVIDMGQRAPGSWVAARYYTLITLGGLGEFSYETFPYPINNMLLPAVRVMVDAPLLACCASQIAGWRLEAGDFAPILAGPARALNSQPDTHFAHITYRDHYHEAVIAIQTREPVRASWAESIAVACNIAPENLYILVAPNASLVCAVQVAARIVEQTIHRLEEEGLAMDTIFSAQGFCVLPPLIDDDLIAMGRINDVLLYGGEATFYLRHPDDAFVQQLAHKVVAKASRAYGQPFIEIFEAANRDFYQIPLDLHSPAVVHLNNLSSGRTFSAGEINERVLTESFFGVRKY